MIGSFFYLTASRPNISYSVGVCARYQSNPKESHVTTIKHIIKYVKSTNNYGAWCDKDTMMFWLGILMLTGLVMLTIVRVLLVGVFTWEIILFLG